MDKSTNHYHILFDNSPIGIALIDNQGNILEVNNALLQILGSPSAEATKAINVLEFPPLQKSPLFSNIKTVLSEKKSINNTVPYLSKWNKMIYVNYHLTPIFNGDEVSHILLYVTDLTQQHEFEQHEQLINNQVQLINQFAFEFIMLDNNADPFIFIGEKIKTLFPDCTIAINKYQPTTKHFTTEYLYSPQKSILQLIESLSAQKLQLHYSVTPELWEINFEGKLIILKQEDFLKVQFSIPQEQTVDIINSAHIEQIFTMGFINDHLLFGNITLFTHKEEKYLHLVELLINQATLLLQRRLVLKQIQNSHTYYHSILNTVEEYIIIANAAYKIQYLNHSLKTLLHKNGLPTSIIGISITEGIPFLDKDIYEQLERVNKTKSNLLYEAKTKIGENTFYYQTIITSLSFNDEYQFIISIRDVTNLTFTQKRIKELTDINNKIIENLNEGVVLLDEQSHVLFANKQFLAFFNLTEKEIFGKDLFSLMHIPKSDKIDGFLEQIKKNPTPVQFEFDFKNLEQEQKFFLHEIYPINENGESRYFVVIFHDITERKRKEMELIESKEKAEHNNLIKSTFIANISHELRTPLNAITGFAGLLHKSDLTEEKKFQYIKQINASSALLSRLIDDLIDITKIETGKLTFVLETIFLFPLLEELQEQYHQELETRNKKHISLFLDNTSQDNIPFYTDKFRLKQILSNLLLNAIKYTYQGEIHLGYKQYNNSVIFYVQDTGTGIKEEDISLLFVPFTQIKNKYVKSQSGSGLGLTIVKNIVELMNGSIHVESEWMKGSTFSIRFPYGITTVPEKSVKEEVTNDQKLSDRKITILIAEDDDINYMFLEEMLSESSLNLIRVRNGKEAVNMYKENADTIDVVLMDIQMPVLDGFTATRLIKEINPAVPVIAQTAYAYSTEMELSKKAGCVDYIVKPIQQDELLKKILKYVK